MAIIYFGTFDPFHENHYNTVKYVVHQYHPKYLFIVPNNDGSSFKPESLSLKDRLELLYLRFEQDPLQRYVRIYSPQEQQTNWYGRKQLCYQIGKEYRLPILSIMVGTDSIESSLSRTNQLEQFPFKILVLPRNGYQLPKLPEKLRDKIKFDLYYQESLVISSTLIRQLMRLERPVPPNICHPRVIHWLSSNHKYSSKMMHQISDLIPLNKSKVMPKIIVLTGSPGCGKTTIGNELARQLDYQFYSTGDLYRWEKEQNSQIYQNLEQHKSSPIVYRQMLNDFIIHKLHGLISDNRENSKGFIIEGLKAGDFELFTKYIAPISRLYWIITSSEIIQKRLETRDRIDDINLEKRLKTYFNLYEPETRIETEYLASQDLISRTMTVDNTGDLSTACQLIKDSLE